MMRNKLLIAGLLFLAVVTAVGIFLYVTSNKTLTIADIKQEHARLVQVNAFSNREALLRSADEYPRVIGVFGEPRLKVIEKIVCSDVCPDQSRVVLVFEKALSEDECGTASGVSVRDVAWGGYIGCAPDIE